MKKMLRPDEVAHLLNVSKKKVYDLVNDIENPLPSTKIGGQIRIPQEGLSKYLKLCKKKNY